MEASLKTATIELEQIKPKLAATEAALAKVGQLKQIVS